MKEIINEIKNFNEERDWGKFHTPENLAKCISIESAELLECFQWDAENFNKQDVYEELADVFTYCFQMSMAMHVDPKQTDLSKLQTSKNKYPVDKSKGKCTKYDRL